MGSTIDYKSAGVDTHEGQRAVKLMKEHVKKTFNENVITDLGSFGGLFKINTKEMEQPVLVSGTDGVGTKLKLAFMTGIHNTIGIDAVAMCVNDILCQGATPLFFLDYIATGKVHAETIANIVSGVAEGCKIGGCALIGGETAEMPDFYSKDEYDIAGFSVGIVDMPKIIDGSKVQEGNKIIGIPSSGIHSNGYSLVRKICFDIKGFKVDDYIEELNEEIGKALLTPTRIYSDVCTDLFSKYTINGIVHITGGGFYENIPRILSDGLGVSIDKKAWEVPKIFKCLMEWGNVEEKEMFSTFNMGIGMMLVVNSEIAESVLTDIRKYYSDANIIGEVIKGDGVLL